MLQRELEETDRQISQMTEALKAARVKHKSLGDALSVLTGQPELPHTSRSISDNGPTLENQILALLAPDGMGLSPAEIANLLTENGRETGNTTVSSTLSRMKKEGIVVKRGGKWFLPQEDTSQRVVSGGLPSALSAEVPAPEAAHTTEMGASPMPLRLQSPDWAHKVAQDLSRSHHNPASAGAGKAETGSASGTSGFPNPNQRPDSQ